MLFEIAVIVLLSASCLLNCFTLAGIGHTHRLTEAIYAKLENLQPDLEDNIQAVVNESMEFTGYAVGKVGKLAQSIKRDTAQLQAELGEQ
jgi:hypothetical protein